MGPGGSSWTLYTNSITIFEEGTGLALALLFRRICKDNCVLYSAPDIKEIEENVFNLEDTCYKYKSYAVKCNAKDKPLEPYDINKTPDNIINIPGFFEKIFSSI